MDAKEIPIVGRAAEIAANVIGQSLRVGQAAGQLAVTWAVSETVAAIDNRVEEMNINHLDNTVRSAFDTALATERSMVEGHIQQSIFSESLVDAARGTMQVYVEHFARFYDRSNHAKLDHYAEKIIEIMPFMPEGFSLTDLNIPDSLCAVELRARTGLSYLAENPPEIDLREPIVIDLTDSVMAEFESQTPR
jgi:hypothetical protein